MLSAFIAAICNATEVVQSKRVLKFYNIPSNTFLSLGSTLIFFVMCLLFPFFGWIEAASIKPFHVALFLGILICGFFYNFLFYYSLKRGKMCDVEPIAMLHPLIATVLAVIIFPDERNFYLVIPAIVASLALALSRIEKHHFTWNKYSLYMLLFVLLISIESLLVKPLLGVISPVALYTFRIGILSALFLVTVKPNLHLVKKDAFLQTLFNSVVVAVEYAFYYFSINKNGIVATSLVMLLAPVLILFSSRFVFREKTGLKKAFADVVILGCIVTAILIS